MSARRRRVGAYAESTMLNVSGDDLCDEHAKLKKFNGDDSTSSILFRNSYIGEEGVMAGRDRTKEFSNTIQNLKSRQIAKAINIRDPKKSINIQSHAQFMMNARSIGKNIASTYSKLEKLTLLAKKRSLFEDRSAEIQELTYIIKEDLSSLNQQISQLQDLAKIQKKKYQSEKQHLISHNSSVLLALQSRLAGMSTEFKQVLEVRTEVINNNTENLKQQKSRREQFFDSNIPSSSIAQKIINNNDQGSLLLQEEHINTDLESQNRDVSVCLQNQLNYDQTNSYLQSRAETMQNIESTIVELGGIYQQLAHMVKEQEEMVDRIDSNIESANINVEAAHGELLKYFQSVTSNRWLMIKVFGILIMFFIFFVIFMT